MLQDLLYRQRETNKIALIQGNNSITYNEWYDESMKLSEIVVKAITKDTVDVGIFLPNSIEYGIAYFSILINKKVIIPIGVKEKKDSVQSICSYSELDAIITDSANMSVLKEMLNDYEYRISFINIDTKEIVQVNTDKCNIAKSDIQLVDGTEDSVAIMLHTSGTTSNPKRVMLTHQSILTNVESNISSLQLNGNDIALITLPMYFGYCNTAQFLTHVYLGATMIIMDNIFMPKQFFTIVEKYRITNFTAVPTLLITLLQYRYSNMYDISSLRYICFGGGKISAEIIEALMKKFPTVGFVQTYGQTECSPRVTSLMPEFSLSKIGSVGKPIPNVQVRIVDEKNEDKEVGEVGQIIVKGKNIMKGYYKREDLTKDTIKEGWLYTGDLGYFDEDKFLYIAGRLKNMIISGGINIYPEEIEEILLTYTGIEDAIVFGREDLMLGEIPIAKIVTSKEIAIEDLKRFCLERLATYKVPREFILCKQLEKTYNGKIKRGWE